jgi:preprotein translocase subunit SecF
MQWLKYKKIYFLVSALMIAASLFALFSWGLRLGVDFRGGTIIEYKFEEEVSTEDLSNKLKEEKIDVTAIQSTGENTYIVKLPPLDKQEKEKVSEIVAGYVESEAEELRFETVGPSVGPELVKKTIYAIAIAAGAILLWVAYQFKSIKFGASAILAMFHDSLILIGSFSILGHFMNVEVDFLLVTALLTTLSFSVHDTIVVFDRIREIGKKEVGGLDEVSNRALTETMVRSLNNSFTIMFMLIALTLLGGTTIKWFAVALLIGTILGTYSSPFVAVPLLVSWDPFFGKFNKIKNLPIRKG